MIVEGPAGSGKTTLGHKLSELYGGLYLPTEPELINRPRDYAGSAGETLAILKDLATSLQASLWDGPVVIDRWAISSFVYNRIRQELADPRQKNVPLRLFNDGAPEQGPIPHFKNILDQAVRLESNGATSLSARGFLPQLRQRQWTLLLPPPRILQERREKSSRLYPFQAVREYEWYKWVSMVWELNFAEHGPMTVLET